jgi:transposase
MSGLILPPEDRAHLLLMMRRQTPSPVHRRMNALLLLDDGWTAEQAAKVLFIDAETVREHHRLYQASGVAGIERLKYEGAASDLSEEQRAALGAELDARLYMTAKAVCAFVQRTFGVTYTAHAAYGWIRKGETRELKSNHGRTNVSINGALSWPGRDFVHRQTGRITSAEMILLFKDLQARHPTASAVRVVLDNARYNHSKELKAWLACDDCRIEVIYLPAYAPNLNLIERFWWLFKKSTIYNEYFPSFADFKAAIDGFFTRLDAYRDEILSLITDKFHFMGKFNPQAP